MIDLFVEHLFYFDASSSPVVGVHRNKLNAEKGWQVKTNQFTSLV